MRRCRVRLHRGSRDRTRETALAAAAYFQRRQLEDRMLLRRDSLRRDSLARAARRP